MRDKMNETFLGIVLDAEVDFVRFFENPLEVELHYKDGSMGVIRYDGQTNDWHFAGSYGDPCCNGGSVLSGREC